jgi:hypothetical protein
VLKIDKIELKLIGDSISQFKLSHQLYIIIKYIFHFNNVYLISRPKLHERCEYNFILSMALVTHPFGALMIIPLPPSTPRCWVPYPLKTMDFIHRIDDFNLNLDM